MIEITRKFASLDILVDGEKRVVTFPDDKMEDYRAVAEVL